jgi:hypothetical protein
VAQLACGYGVPKIWPVSCIISYGQFPARSFFYFRITDKNLLGYLFDRDIANGWEYVLFEFV